MRRIIPQFDEIIRKYSPEFKDVGYYFKNYLQRFITPETKLLDVGCGTQAFGEEYYKTAKWRVGVDPSEHALEQNQIMDEKIHGQISDIPSSLGQFDVVVAQWVMEHLEHPDADLEIISRLTKPGGYFVFMTTNLYSPLMFTSKLLPTAWKKFLKDRLIGIAEEHTHPTYYRINTAAQIDRILMANGFQKLDMRLVGVYTYFGFSRWVLLVKLLVDKMLNPLKFLKKLDAHIVGVYRKL